MIRKKKEFKHVQFRHNYFLNMYNLQSVKARHRLHGYRGLAAFTKCLPRSWDL